MKRTYALAFLVLALAAATAVIVPRSPLAAADDEAPKAEAKQKVDEAKQKVDEAAVNRARKTALMLDDIYKNAIVLITDKYVNDEDDFAAGAAAVLWFKTISDKGSHTVRLIDATGDPYDADNVAKDEFEKQGVASLKEGKANAEKVVEKDGKPYLRVLTPVPVVLQKCIMCHPHYEDAKEGEPIGAISYTIPIE
jgi:hypothetical protein